MASEIRFYETAYPTLIRDLVGNDELQQGRSWIDLYNGEILKIERSSIKDRAIEPERSVLSSLESTGVAPKMPS